MTRARDGRALALRWLLTAVFAAAGLGSLPVPGRAGTARMAAGVSEVFHALMCAAWFQQALFGCAVIWFGLVSPGESRSSGRAGYLARPADPRCRVIPASRAARPGVREPGVEAGGLMARAVETLREKMGTAAGSLATSWP
jgi:hypothetical protein